jgi:hypothetical protein
LPDRGPFCSLRQRACRYSQAREEAASLERPMLPRLPPNLEITIRGAAGVICVQWRQAMRTGRVKGGQAAQDAQRPGWGAGRPVSQEGGPVEAWSGLDEDSANRANILTHHRPKCTPRPSDLVSRCVVTIRSNRKSVRVGQIFSLNGVGHHTRRRVRSVHAARVSSRVCGKHMWSRRSPGGPAAVATPGPRLHTSAGRLYSRLGGTIARDN